MDYESMGVVLVDANGNKVGANHFQVFPENDQAAALFYRCSTQWHHAPFGGLLGLNYPALESVARVTGCELSPELFDDIRLIEAGALGQRPEFPDLDALNITRVERVDDGEFVEDGSCTDR